MRILFIFLGLIGMLFSDCNSNQTFREAISPPKVKGIPEQAFWRGGKNGGNWFFIESIEPVKGIANIKIYDDKTGEVIKDNSFKLQCNSEMEVQWNNMNEQIQMFDGEKILLHVIQEENKYCYFQ